MQQTNSKYPWLDAKYVAKIEEKLKWVPDQYKAAMQQSLYNEYYQIQKREQDQIQRQEVKNEIAQKNATATNPTERTTQNANLKLADLADTIRKYFHIDLSAWDDNQVINKFVSQVKDWSKKLIDYVNWKNDKILTTTWLQNNQTKNEQISNYQNFSNQNSNQDATSNNTSTLEARVVDGRLKLVPKTEPTESLRSSSHFDDDDYASNWLAQLWPEYDDFIDWARSQWYMDWEIAATIDAVQTYERLQKQEEQRMAEYENRGWGDKGEELNTNLFQGFVNFFANAYNNLFAANDSIWLTHGHYIDMEKIHFSDDLLGAWNNIGDLRDNSGWSKGGKIWWELAANVVLMRMMPEIWWSGEFWATSTLKSAGEAGAKWIMREFVDRGLIWAAEWWEFWLLSSIGEENVNGSDVAKNVWLWGALWGLFGLAWQTISTWNAFKKWMSQVLEESGEKSILKSLQEQFNKSVKPSSRWMQTKTQVEKYDNDAIDSVELIIKNKDNLKFVDVNGEETVWQLPKNLDEFSQAIKQTKEKLYSEYNAIAKEAWKDATVDTTKIVNELKALRNNEEWMAGKSEATKNEIDKWIRDLEWLNNKLSVEWTQTKIQELNEELAAFLKSKNPNDVWPNWIKAKVNGWLKDWISDSIENAWLDSVEYQNLKRAYGSLRTIESDVNHRAIVYGRQNPESLVDSLSELSSIDAMAKFIKNPVEWTLKFIWSQIEKYWAKSRNNPNNIIKKLFWDAEDVVNKNSTLKTKAQQEAKASMDAQARQEANIKKAREERLAQRQRIAEELNKIKAENEARYQKYKDRLKKWELEHPALPWKQSEYSSIVHDNNTPIAVDPKWNVIKWYNEVQEIPAKSQGEKEIIEKYKQIVRDKFWIEGDNAPLDVIVSDEFQSLTKKMQAEIDALWKKSWNTSIPDYNIWSKGADTDARLKFDTEWEWFSKLRSKKADYMIVSAENPMWKQASAEFNAKTTEEFRKFLDDNGIKWKAQKGMYNNPENSQIIAIDNPKQRALIDKRLEKHSKQQENMIVKNWYAYRYDPRTNEAYKVDLKKADIDLPAETDNFYSEIDGRKYQLPLYWELEQPITVEEFLSIYNS